MNEKKYQNICLNNKVCCSFSTTDFIIDNFTFNNFKLRYIIYFIINPYIQMKKIIYIFLLILLTIILSSCWNKETTRNNIHKIEIETEEKTEKTLVKIWVLAPLSWWASSYWKDAVNTYQKSLDEYKKQNNKIDVELIIEDSKCNWKDSISAVQKLINIDKVAFILGWICSSETIAAWKIAENKKIIMLSPVSSSPEISEMWDYIYRYWNDAHAGSSLSNYLNTKYKNITLIVENTDYAKALANKLKKLYEWKIALEINFDSNEKDFLIIANNVNKTESEALILLNQTESSVISIIKSLKTKWLVEKYKKENIIWAYFFSSALIKKALWKKYMNWFIQVNIDSESSVVPKWLVFIEELKKEYEIYFNENMMYLEKEWIDFMLESIKKWITSSEWLKLELDSITKENPRQWYFWEYYIDDKWDAVGLKYSIEKIISGGIQKLSY